MADITREDIEGRINNDNRTELLNEAIGAGYDTEDILKAARDSERGDNRKLAGMLLGFIDKPEYNAEALRALGLEGQSVTVVQTTAGRPQASNGQKQNNDDKPQILRPATEADQVALEDENEIKRIHNEVFGPALARAGMPNVDALLDEKDEAALDRVQQELEQWQRRQAAEDEGRRGGLFTRSAAAEFTDVQNAVERAIAATNDASFEVQSIDTNMVDLVNEKLAAAGLVAEPTLETESDGSSRIVPNVREINGAAR